MSTEHPESPIPNVTQNADVIGTDAATSAPDRTTEFQELLRRATPRTFVTPILIAINVLVFVIMIASGVDPMEPTVEQLLKWGANLGAKTIAGEWWRIATCCFIHIGFMHLLLNMWVLADAGMLVERMFGNRRFLGLYLFSGLCGSLASLYWNPMLTSAGASGAIFGIYGALLGALVRRSRDIPVEALSNLRNSGLTFVGFNLFYGMIHPNIDSAAHLGGLAGGFLCGLVLHLNLNQAAVPTRLIRSIAVSIGAILLIFGGISGVREHHRELLQLQQELDRFAKIEAQVLERYNDAVTKAQQMQLTDLQIADVMKTEVLPEWQDSIAQLSHFNPKLREQLRIDPLLEYMRLRERQWDLFEQACREQNPDKGAQSSAQGVLADAALGRLTSEAKKK